MEQTLLLHPAGKQVLFDRLADDLEARSYSVIPGALDAQLCASLSAHLDSLGDTDFQPAGVGRGMDSGPNRFVRSNRIHWLESVDSRTREWIAWTENLQAYLNRRLFLGLASFESHFTRYDKGDYYKRHMDTFLGQRNRVVSLVTYLNDGWQPDQGGELVLYPKDSEAIRVTPETGTLVLFLSEVLPHEVLPASRIRFGVAGWFRVDRPEDIRTR